MSKKKVDLCNGDYYSAKWNVSDFCPDAEKNLERSLRKWRRI